MDQGATPASRPRLAGTLAWIGLALVLGASLCVSVHPWYDPTNDGSMYIATARSLVAGEGYSYLGMPFVIRPPGFACLIAPVLALRGTDFFALNLTVSICGALGILAFHFFLRPRLGLVLATLVPLVLWFNPGYQRLCNQVMSDVPGWAALVPCLALARAVLARPAVGRAAALGVAVALATYLRSGNLIVLPAVLGVLALHQLRSSERAEWGSTLRTAGTLVAAALLVLGPWALRDQAVAPPPPADQTLLHSYASGMWHADMGDPSSPRLPWSAILARFPVRAEQIERTLGTRMIDGGAPPPLVALVLVVVLVVAFVRWRRAEELFALGTLLVVAFYFGYAGRLLLPVFALALAAVIELLREGVARVGGARAGTVVAALACVGWAALDWHPRAGWEEVRALHERYLEMAHKVKAVLPEDARLGAWRGWHHAVYLERPVWSFEQACERANDPAAAEAIVDRYRLDTVLLTPLGLPEPVQRAERAFAAYVARTHGGRDVGLVRVR